MSPDGSTQNFLFPLIPVSLTEIFHLFIILVLSGSITALAEKSQKRSLPAGDMQSSKRLRKELPNESQNEGTIRYNSNFQDTVGYKKACILVLQMSSVQF